MNTRIRHAIGLSLAAGFFLTAASSSAAQVATHEIRLSGWSAGGSGCTTTFTRTPGVPRNVASINIKFGGALPTVPDPGYWHIDSPTLVMPLATTPIYVEEFVGGVAVKGWHESNTLYHNGAFVSGTWTVEFNNPSGAPCSDYDNHVRVTFTTTP